MKTHAFRKVLSVVCVIAMLMSVCVVGLVGVSSAADNDYTLYHNGTITQKTLAEGAALPDPGPYKGAKFLGWYDETFTNEHKTAGEKTTLYAKYSAAIFDFELDASHYTHGASNCNFVYGVIDPTDSNNKVVKFTIDGTHDYIAVPITEGAKKTYEFKAGVEYTVYFKYYGVETTGDITLRVYNSTPDAVNKAWTDLNNDDEHHYIRPTEASVPYLRPAPYPPYDNWLNMTPPSGEWNTMKMKVTFTQEDIDAGRTALVLHMNQNNTGVALLFDDLIVVEDAEEVNVTLNDNGSVITEKYLEGVELPKVSDPNFTGWYDENLRYQYEYVPDTDVKLYAKYKKVFDTFENDSKIFDPNNKFPVDNGFKLVVDSVDAANHVLSAPIGATVVDNYAITGADGAKAGFTINKGQLYTVKLKYKASGIGASGAKIYFKSVDNASIGSGNDAGILEGWEIALENTDEWKEVNVNFSLSGASTINLAVMKNLVMAAYGADSNGTLLIDNFSVGPYAPPIDPNTANLEMDFEAEGGFSWSVEDANKYDKSSGNGYVNRGELVTEANNTFFRVSHFNAKGAYIYFTLDDGLRQFEVANQGIYTIEFDYKVVHSETKSSIGMFFVKPTTESTGFKFSSKPVVEFDSFSTDNISERDDKSWTHVTYTFGADLAGIEDYTSVGLYVYNESNVPEMNTDLNKLTATVVEFDNIVVKTNSKYAGDGMIVFDSKGGTSCENLITASGEPIGALPEPTMYGCVFTGWKYDTDTGAKELTPNTVMPGFVTYAYATWEPAPGAVLFNIHSNVPEYDAKYQSVVAYPGKPLDRFPAENPSMAGQEFVGWYYDSAFTKPVNFKSAAKESGDIYAKWGKGNFTCNFEDYNVNKSSDRADLITDSSNNNHYIDWWAENSLNNFDNAASFYAFVINDKGAQYQVYSNFEYTVTFKYKLIEGSLDVHAIANDSGYSWSARKEQTDGTNPTVTLDNVDPDNWQTASFTFTAKLTDLLNNYISFGVAGLGHAYFDDIVITSDINTMNMYGSLIVLDTNGGKPIQHVSGPEGSEIKLPTPVKPNYKFMGWYTDSTLTTKFTETVYGSTPISLVAKWQLGKYVESFEELPNTVLQLAVDPAYSLYSDKIEGFDKSNVRSGSTSLFRKGSTAGVKNFTTARSYDLALTVGDSYTLTMYVKPTSVGDAAGTINILSMANYTSTANPSSSAVVANVSDLKVGEWNKITYKFTATAKFVGISTSAGNDMYIDDISITLDGYSSSANTGDSSVNPLVIIAMVIVCAGALLITGKKVFSK